jgi:bifunctional DNA-binding transcriptional regulator/antitoxin component of YhaV-PrlF toxin-antitoxin module
MKLKVLKALQEDSGNSRVRIAQTVREQLGVSPGDRVRVRSNGRSVVLVVAKGDTALIGRSVCRLDATDRRALGIAPGDEVDLTAGSSGGGAGLDDIDRHEYDVIIVERDVDNPFQISPRMIEIARKATNGKRSAITKARALFDWMQANIRYGSKKRRRVGYRDSVEVKVTGEGVCGEQAILYGAMSRCIGLTANYVSVTIDCQSQRVNHACAGVNVDGELLLVDPAYHRFGVRHQEFEVLSDDDAHTRFRGFRAR